MSDSDRTKPHPQVGYFTDPTQTVPVYDPPHDGPCLVCWTPLTDDNVMAISLLPINGERSLFFRVHRTCAEQDREAVEAIEHSLIDGEGATPELHITDTSTKTENTP